MPQVPANEPIGMSLRAYAKRRGVAPPSVLRAVRSGRLKRCLVFDADGKAKIADPDIADQEWAAAAAAAATDTVIPSTDALPVAKTPSHPPPVHTPPSPAAPAAESPFDETAARLDGLLTRFALAKALNVHPQTITKWEDEGLPIAKHGGKGRPTLYDEVAVRAWRQEKDEASAIPGAPIDALQARARKEYWQAMLAEQLHLQRSKRLLDVADVEKAWMAEAAAVRTIVMGAYVTHADRVFRAAKIDGVAGVERELKQLGDEVLQQLADPARALAALDVPPSADEAVQEVLRDADEPSPSTPPAPPAP